LEPFTAIVDGRLTTSAVVVSNQADILSVKIQTLSQPRLWALACPKPKLRDLAVSDPR